MHAAAKPAPSGGAYGQPHEAHVEGTHTAVLQWDFTYQMNSNSTFEISTLAALPSTSQRTRLGCSSALLVLGLERGDEAVQPGVIAAEHGSSARHAPRHTRQH